jgi:hypothetical protein
MTTPGAPAPLFPAAAAAGAAGAAAAPNAPGSLLPLGSGVMHGPEFGCALLVLVAASALVARWAGAVAGALRRRLALPSPARYRAPSPPRAGRHQRQQADDAVVAPSEGGPPSARVSLDSTASSASSASRRAVASPTAKQLCGLAPLSAPATPPCKPNALRGLDRPQAAGALLTANSAPPLALIFLRR